MARTMNPDVKQIELELCGLEGNLRLRFFPEEVQMFADFGEGVTQDGTYANAFAPEVVEILTQILQVWLKTRKETTSDAP